MAAPLYSATNLLADATTIAAQTLAGAALPAASGGFDAANLVDGFPGTVFRPGSNAAGRIVCDLGTARQTSVVGVFRHRFNADATVLWRGSTNGSTWTTIVDLSASLGLPAFYRTYTPVTYRYYALEVQALGTGTAVWQVGEVWSGAYTALSTDVDWGVRVGREHRSIGVETEYGVPIDYHQGSAATMAGEFGEGLTAAERDEYAALVDAVKGNVCPFLWAPDRATAACYLAKSRITKHDPRLQSVGRWADMPLDLFEIPAGREGL